MIISRSTFVVLVASTLLAGCFRLASPIGVPLPQTNRFEAEWRDYRNLEPNKALAVAGDMSGVYVTGYAFGNASETGAVQAALQACDARRVDRRIASPCRTYAVGDHPVETASTSETLVR
jgi:hypothetical protein